MRSAIVMIVAVALGGALSGCGGGNSSSAAVNPPPTSGGPPPPAGPPTDFAMYVNQQVNQPNLSLGLQPVATSGLTNDLQLDNAGAFSSVFFGTGDALPAGTNQASVACGQAGKAACDPSSSADLNSTLN